MILPCRAWINQPSLLQPLHKHHGMLVIATYCHMGLVRVFPISGDVISMIICASSLSKGWPKHLRSKHDASS